MCRNLETGAMWFRKEAYGFSVGKKLIHVLQVEKDEVHAACALNSEQRYWCECPVPVALCFSCLSCLFLTNLKTHNY